MLMHQQPNRRDRLHRFAESHFVGQHGFVPRIEERDAIQLVAKRRKRKSQRARRQQRFQRRLQQQPQPVFQLHDVARRPNARVAGSVARQSDASCAKLIRVARLLCPRCSLLPARLPPKQATDTSRLAATRVATTRRPPVQSRSIRSRPSCGADSSDRRRVPHADRIGRELIERPQRCRNQFALVMLLGHGLRPCVRRSAVLRGSLHECGQTVPPNRRVDSAASQLPQQRAISAFKAGWQNQSVIADQAQLRSQSTARC